MTTLLRKMWKTHSKHKKLSEEWALAECEGEGWWREGREAGAPGQIDVRYAGVAPVERAASAPTTAIAVRSALHSAKLLNKKPQRVNLDISPRGIIVTDADSNENVLSISIYKEAKELAGEVAQTSQTLLVREPVPFQYRISYCSADAANARVFAVVEGKTEVGALESHVVHAFVCARRKHARALALSLAHAFNDAYQAWQANQSSSAHARAKRLAPWVRFPDESEEEIDDEEDCKTPAPLVTFT